MGFHVSQCALDFNFGIGVLPVELVYPEESQFSFALGDDFHPLFFKSSSELIGGLLLKLHWTGNDPDIRLFLIEWMLVAKVSFRLKRVLAFR